VSTKERVIDIVFSLRTQAAH